MNKKLKILLTLLLILTMLFGVMSTTVLAAAGSSEDTVENVSSTGSLDTGWCEITYNSGGITVTLNPDVKSLLDINEEEIKEVVDILIDAAKTIIFEDIKADVMDGEKSELKETYKAAPLSENESQSLNFKNLLTSALNAFIDGRYGAHTSQEYIKFMQDILNDATADDSTDATNTTVEDFIAHILELVELAVASGEVSAEQLPEANDSLRDTIISIFNEKINSFVDDAVEELLPRYAEDYLSDIVNEDNVGYEKKLDESVRALIDTTVADYVEAEVNEYINNGFKVLPESEDPVDSIVGSYTDNQIRVKVKEWITNYGAGDLAKNPTTVNSLIDSKIQSYVSEFVTHYFAGTTPENNPIYDHIANLADSMKTDKIEEYKNAFLNCTEINSNIENLMYDYIKVAVYDLFWLNRAESITNNAPFDEGSVWLQIENALVAEIVKAKMETAVKNAIEAAIDKAIPKAVDEVIFDAVTESIKDAVDEAIERAVDEAIEKVVKEAIDEAIETNAERVKNDLIYEKVNDYIQELIDGGLSPSEAEAKRQEILNDVLSNPEIMADINEQVEIEKNKAIHDIYEGSGYELEFNGENQRIQYEAIIIAINSEEGYIVTVDGDSKEYKRSDIITAINSDTGYKFTIGGEEKEFKREDILNKIFDDDGDGYTFTYGEEDYFFKRADIIAAINSDTGYKFTIGGKEKEFKRADIIAAINSADGYTVTINGETKFFKRADMLAAIYNDEDGYTFTINGITITLKYSEIYEAVKDENAQGYTVTFGNEIVTLTYKDIYDKIYEEYRNTSNETILAELTEEDKNKFLSEIVTEIKKLDSVNRKEIWNNELSDTDRTNIIGKVETSDVFEDLVKAEIEKRWISGENAAENRQEAVNELVSNTQYSTLLDSFLATIINEALNDKDNLAIIKGVVEELWENEDEILSEFYSMIRELASFDQDKYTVIKEAVIDKATSIELTDDIISQVFVQLFEMTRVEIEAKINDPVISTFLEKYGALREKLLESPEIEIDYVDLIKYVKSVTVNGITLYEDGIVGAEALKKLAATIPTPSEIANMSNEQMQLSYSFSVKTTFNTSTDFTVTARLGGGYDKVRKLAALISEYVDVSFGAGNTLILNVKVPAKFSELVLKAANSEKVPEELKKKVFAAFEKSPDDVYALLNDVTLEELFRIFDYVDFEEIITSNYLKDFESLEGLTEEQIKNKIMEYEEQYNKLLTLAKRIYNNNVPDSIKNKTIFSLYDGSGKFSFAGSKTVNVVSVLNKFSEKYGELIAAFLDFTTVTVGVDAKIEFEKINKVTYVVDGKTHSTGLLPEGADLAYFAGITEHDGKPITEWLGDDGIVYSKMPDKDVVLTAQFEVIPEPEISVSDDIDKTYDGQRVDITATVRGEIPEGIEVTYQWYKKTTPTSEPTKLEGKTGNTLTLRNVSDSGLYYCEVTLTGSSGSFVNVTTDAVNVNIRKAVIDLSDYHWYSEPFVYDGTVKEVYLVDANGNRLNIFGVKYAGASGIKAGNYKARVELLDYYNFEFSEETQPSEFIWTIDKATVDMSGVTFKNKTVKYDGFAHSLSISGVLPEGVVSVEYSENSFTEPGVYTVTAVFTVDDNYNPIPDMYATLRILGFKNQYEIIDTDKKLIVRIESEQGIWENHILNFKDVSAFYASFDFGTFFGEGYRGVLGGAYDLHFAEDGTQQKTTGNFTVRLLIPVNLRNSTNPLKVVHIADNGDVEDMNATVDGDYMVFNTTHFSVYSIVEVVTDDSLPPSDDGKDNAWIWILLAILTLLIIVAIVIFVIARRNPKDAGPAPETENTAEPEPVDEPVIEQTSEEPTEEEPTIQEPTIEESAIEEPVAEESVLDAPPAPVITLTGNDGGEAIINGEVVHVRYRTSFMSRLIQSGDIMQDYYTALKNALLSYKGVKARGSWNFESFNKGREQCAKLNVKGNALQLYLALDPKEYNANKYHFTDVSDKPKLDQVPMMLKVKSERGLKYAFELIEEMMNKLGIEKTEEPKNDYRMPYETTEELAARGLVKIILPAGVKLDGDENLVKVNVGELLDNVKAGADVADSEVATEEPVAEATEIEEPAADVPVIEEQAVEEPVAEAPTAPVITLTGNDSGEAIINGEVVHVRYRTSFMSRLIQSGDVIQDYYTALKNALLSYKGVKARGSWNFESFNKGRVQCAKLNVKGSALQVYLALDPNEYSVTKYHFTDVSDKPKLDQVPMMLKVKSARGLKSALELVDEMMSKLGIEKGKASELDFHMPYETTEELAARELVKVILPKGVKLDGDESLVKVNVGELLDNAKAVADTSQSEPVAQEPVAEKPVEEEPTEEILHLDAIHADEILSDEEAVSKIEVVERVPGEKGQGKLVEINLDTICENFEDGETVTLEALKAKKLVNKNAGRIKVLARGVMTKNLTVYADKFSLQAVKMITLAGGHADQYK